MSEVGRWFPGVFRWGIALPTDAELSAGGGTPVGNDGFNSIFFFSMDDGGWGR